MSRLSPTKILAESEEGDTLPLDVKLIIKGYLSYDSYNWEDLGFEEVERLRTLNLSKTLLRKTYKTISYLNYIYHKIGREEVFDLPDVLIPDIINSIPIIGFSRFLRLSERRIEEYKDYMNGFYLSKNHSLTYSLFKKYKDNMDLSEYSKVMKLNRKVLDGVVIALRKEKDYKYLNVLKNPEFIEFFDVYFDELYFEYSNDIKQRIIKIASNPAVNMNIIQKIIEHKSWNEIHKETFILALSRNKHLDFGIVSWLLQNYKYFGVTGIIVQHHIIDHEFKTSFGSVFERYLTGGSEDVSYKNPTIGIRTAKNYMDKKAILYFTENPLARLDLAIEREFGSKEWWIQNIFRVQRNAMTPQFLKRHFNEDYIGDVAILTTNIIENSRSGKKLLKVKNNLSYKYVFK